MSTDLFGVRVLDLDPERRCVRLRVFVVYYEPSWGTNELLPDDPSFFFRVLWEGANALGRRSGQGLLGDLVGLDEFLDTEWVDRHTHLFVARVARVATRNHPVDDDAWDHLAMFYHERDGRWQDEHLLAQGDYDVYVTDVRWLAALRPGQSWGTTCYVSKAAPALEADSVETRCAALAAGGDRRAAFLLGWLRQDKGDSVGAVAAYQQAAEGNRGDERAKALLYLGDLHAELGATEPARAAYEDAIACPRVSSDGDRYRSRAALGLGTLFRRMGREQEARSAYELAERFGGRFAEAYGERHLVQQARRLAGTETWAEQTCRVLWGSGRDGAVRALTEACRSAVVAHFGTALAERDFDRAATELTQVTDPIEVETAAGFGVDLAAVWTRERDDDAVARVLELVVSTGAAAAGYQRALAEGLIKVAGSGRDSPSAQVALQLYVLLERGGDRASVAQLARTAEQAHPEVAARAFEYLGVSAKGQDDLETGAEWLQRGAALAESAPDAAAGAAYTLGVLRAEQGDVHAAREAFIQAEKGYVPFADRARAARRLAELEDGQGAWTAASIAWTRAAFFQAQHDLGREKHARWSISKLGDLLADAGEEQAARMAHTLAGNPPKPSTHPEAATSATHHFAHWIGTAGHRELAQTLLKTIAEGTSPHAALAAINLGVASYNTGDDDAARTWWTRALMVGKPGANHHVATMNLAMLAKKHHDLPETLRLLGPVASSQHRDAALAAAHIAELHYRLKDFNEARRWYQKTLDTTNDPELIGESAYRVGEILHASGETETARPFLEQAAATHDATFAPLAISLLTRPHPDQRRSEPVSDRPAADA